MRWSAIVLGLAVFAASPACSRAPEPQPTPPQLAPVVSASASPSSNPVSAAFPDTVAVPERLVAIGDLHGDLDATRRALRLAGAIDGADTWKGGKLVVVQTGDEIDRGDDDRAVLDLFERLKGQASAAGGAVVAMSGNHEIMNVMADFRYVTPAAMTSFEGRKGAFAAGSGAYAKLLADRPVVARVGGTLFVHGGILPKHVTYGLTRIDTETSEWLLGKRASPPTPIAADDGPLWTRLYSQGAADENVCRTLDEVLRPLGAKRLVMGHTVQKQINSVCDGKAWRIDVGMSKFFSEGGLRSIQVLQIKGDDVSVLKE